MQVSTTPNKDLPTLLMYMDSFGVGTKNFFSLSFRKATFIQVNPSDPDLLSLKKIDEINPNIVIIEVVERGFNKGGLYFLLRNLLLEKN